VHLEANMQTTENEQKPDQVDEEVYIVSAKTTKKSVEGGDSKTSKIQHPTEASQPVASQI